MENRDHKVKIRIIYDRKSRITLGARVCSDYDVSMGIYMFSTAVEEQVTIDKPGLFDLFFFLHLSKPCDYVTMAALGVEQDGCREPDEIGSRSEADEQGGLELVNTPLLFILLRGKMGKYITKGGDFSLWKRLRERI